MIKINLTPEGRIAQGDIFKDIEFIEKSEIVDGELIISKIVFPYAMVVSQDCDLQWDSVVRIKRSEQSNVEKINTDKQLISIIMLPLYNAEHFITGEHLSQLGYSMQTFSRGKTPINDIYANNNSRYHFLKFDETVPIPDTIIDFKHYFTVEISQLLDKIEYNRVCRVSELFREQISHRFTHYLSRIGLPD